jgi:hypothetical protein
MKKLVRPALAVAIALVATAASCVPTDPGTTTTTTSTTSTSLPGGPCDDYTPTGVSALPNATTVGGNITVSGTGAPGSTVVLTLVSVADASVVDPGVSTVVQPDGTFSTPLTVSGVTAGEWDVLATVNGNCSASARIQVS